MKLECAVCGTAFEGRRTAKYCSRPCFEKSRLEYHRRYNRTKRPRKNKPELGPSREQKEKMVLMYYNGSSIKEISESVLGKPSANKTVRKSLVEFNVIIKRGRRILGWHSVDWSKTTDQIAEDMGVHPTSVARRRNIYAPETVKRHEKEDRECPGCGKVFSEFPGNKRKHCSNECARKSGKHGRDGIERMISMYEQGYGMKHIAEIIIGRASAKTTVKYALQREGVESRSDREGLRLSKHLSAKGGKRSEIRRSEGKRMRLSSKLELPLFEFGSKQSAKKYKYDPEASRRQYERANEKAKSRGYESAYQMRYQTDRRFRMHQIYRRRFNKFKMGGNSESMSTLLECSYDELIQWIEEQWEDWMSWDNYGESSGGEAMKRWHIDHAMPCSWFDHESNDDLEICWNYRNLRPMCAYRNISIGNSGYDTMKYLESLPDSPMKARMIQRAKVELNVRNCLIAN